MAKLHNKTDYVIHIVLKMAHRVIKFNQKSWAKIIYWYEDRAKKKTKDDFQKGFYEMMNNSVSGKATKNSRKHRNIKLVTTEERRNYLESGPN